MLKNIINNNACNELTVQRKNIGLKIGSNSNNFTNFAKNYHMACSYTPPSMTFMKGIRIAGFIFLGLLWIWLSQYLLRFDGINLKNLLLVAMTGIIILVPLYRKYIDPANKDNNKK